MNAKNNYLFLIFFGMMLACTAPKGDVGPKGPNGTNGADGTNGTNGTAGAAGATGDKGATGSTGATGATGATGTPGATGATGATTAVYSEWKPLVWKVQSESTSGGLTSVIFVAEFKEVSITEKILTGGTYFIFYRTKIGIANAIVEKLQVELGTTKTLTSPVERYRLITSKLSVGSFTVNATFTSSSQSTANLLKGLNDENYAIQTYVIPGK